MGNINIAKGVSLSIVTGVDIERFLKTEGSEYQTGNHIKAAFPTAQKIARVIKWSNVWEAFCAWFYSHFRKGEYVGLVDVTVRRYQKSLPTKNPTFVVPAPPTQIPVHKLEAFEAARERILAAEPPIVAPKEGGTARLNEVFTNETIDPAFVRRIEGAWQRLTNK